MLLVTSPVPIPRALSPARPAAEPPACRTAPAARPWLLSWLLLGALVVLVIPPARGNDLLGATLPFWLIAAPTIDLLWLARRGRGRVQPRSPSRLRSMRRRNSSMMRR